MCEKHAQCVRNMPHVQETCPMCKKYALYDVRNPIKDPPVHHIQVGSLEDMVVPEA